jgi:hypothetical protein
LVTISYKDIDLEALGLGERKKELAPYEKWILQYSYFKKATKLGISYGPKDLDIETLNIFHEIESIITELDNKRSEHGNGSPQAHIRNSFRK